MKVLDVGCGKLKHGNAFGVDIDPGSDADCLADVGRDGLPFKNSIFDMVICRHVLEHLENLERVMGELHRIGVDGARVVITTPHFTCVHSYTDISHRYHFSLNSFQCFYRNTKACFYLKKKRLKFRTLHRLMGLELLFNMFPGVYEKYWLYLFPAKEIQLVLEVVKNQ